MSEITTTNLLDGVRFPESPRWHAGQLWFVDMFAQRVMTVDLDGRTEIVAEFDDDPAGLGFLPDGSVLVVLMNRRRIVRLGPLGPQVHADLTHIPGNFLNDLIVLPDGTAYVGNVAWRDHRQSGTDAIICVQPDGSSRVVADHADMPLMEQPNGMAITPDRRTLIFATSRYGRETADLRVTAMSIDDDGSLSNARVFARIDGLDPDGLCIDADGAIWVATLSGNSFLRVLDGGEVTDVVPVGDRLAVACTLGGPSGTTLFMLCVTGERGPNLRSEAVGSIDVATVASGRAGWP